MTFERKQIAIINLMLSEFGVRDTTTTEFAIAETLVELEWRQKEWYDKASDYSEVRSEAMRQIDQAKAKYRLDEGAISDATNERRTG